jgi:hypothetical protein
MLRGMLEAVSQQLFFSPRKDALAPFDEARRAESIFSLELELEIELNT